MKANYKQLTRFCPVGRELRQKFDDDPEPGKHRLQSKAYFEHVHDCYWCKQASNELLRENKANLAYFGVAMN